MPVESLHLPSPFPGMRPFRREEASIFFGQAEALARLVKRLAQSRFVAVMGVSGCGKSSLVQAGLIPELAGQAGSLEESGWIIAKTQPGNQPLQRLAECLVEAGLSPNAERTLAMLRTDSRAISELSTQLSNDRRLLLLVDQFEELFSYLDDARTLKSLPASATNPLDEASLYVKLLLGTRKDPSERTYVLLTMRSEYIGRCSEFFGLPEAITDGAYLLPKMSWAQRSAAIAGPLGRESVVDNELVQRLLNESEAVPEDGLPLMQHAIRTAWDRARQRGEQQHLTLRHLAGESSNDGARPLIVREFAANVRAAFEEVPDKQTAIRLFKLLGRYDENRQLVRRRTTVDAIAAVANVSAQAVKDVIAPFRDESKGRSFLALWTETDRDGRQREWVTVSHEALLRQWDEARNWIEEEEKDAERFRRLAEKSDQHDSGEGDWLRDRDLERALEWYRRFRPTAPWANRYEGAFDAKLGRPRLAFIPAETYLLESNRRQKPQQ